MTSKHDSLIQQYLGDNNLEHTVARMILIAMGEDIVEELIDTYYAGISVENGLLILKMLAKIGGYESLNVLRDVFTYEAESPILKRTAALGLMDNAQNLSPDEYEQLSDYLSNT